MPPASTSPHQQSRPMHTPGSVTESSHTATPVTEWFQLRCWLLRQAVGLPAQPLLTRSAEVRLVVQGSAMVRAIGYVMPDREAAGAISGAKPQALAPARGPLPPPPSLYVRPHPRPPPSLFGLWTIPCLFGLHPPSPTEAGLWLGALPQGPSEVQRDSWPLRMKPVGQHLRWFLVSPHTALVPACAPPACAGVLIAILVLFAGFVCPRSLVPGWWIWLYYLNPLAWGMGSQELAPAWHGHPFARSALAGPCALIPSLVASSPCVVLPLLARRRDLAPDQ